MSKLLTKEEILRGADKTETIFIKELNGEVEIRQLNEAQWAEIESKTGITFDMKVPMGKDGNPDIAKMGQDVKMKLEVDEIQKKTFEANILTCKYGMVIKVTEEELKKITPPGTIEKIAGAIKKISNITEDQAKALKIFRKE